MYCQQIETEAEDLGLLTAIQEKVNSFAMQVASLPEKIDEAMVQDKIAATVLSLEQVPSIKVELDLFVKHCHKPLKLESSNFFLFGLGTDKSEQLLRMDQIQKSYLPIWEERTRLMKNHLHGLLEIWNKSLQRLWLIKHGADILGCTRVVQEKIRDLTDTLKAFQAKLEPVIAQHQAVLEIEKLRAQLDRPPGTEASEGLDVEFHMIAENRGALQYHINLFEALRKDYQHMAQGKDGGLRMDR